MLMGEDSRQEEMKKSKPTVMKYEDLTIRLSSGNFGEYTYLSPRWGYKRTYRYNQIIYIYFGDFDDGFSVTHHFKSATRAQIIDWLKEFRQSREYQVRRKRADKIRELKD